MPHHIVVLGAGVIGLQTALALLEAEYKVTVIAQHFPEDQSIEYTSPWAGAIWRTHAAIEQEEMCRWDLESYRYWMGMSEDENKAKEMGLERQTIYILYRNTPITPSSPLLWFSSSVQNFSILPSASLPAGCTFGISYLSIAIHPSKYLLYLQGRAKELGAIFIKSALSTFCGLAGALSEAQGLLAKSTVENDSGGAEIFVNCTGLGSKALCNDNTVYPIRGQTLLVRIQPPPLLDSLGIYMLDDPTLAPDVTYVVPRPGESGIFVLGGTKTADDWSAEVDEGVSEGIIERCREAYPQGLGEGKTIEVLNAQVGLRPGREGGPRVEIETIEQVKFERGKEQEVVSVVHQYGHAGAGYQNSIGSAGKVLGLIRSILE
ncbi:nucleotide-binding domain-containing protein [Delitschia confertaspora ATCC 74209]|uniref:Nucleotide-binding domain-containing protein n=1 Tax=Delitschia confertaspora ATCC 74209 TaxID=1513339 RepID=A0A9P4JRZ6_9PLEO|nr:nucleotide-binding domain-containing protein [Delitschia confertaspora ATCC 74209]